MIINPILLPPMTNGEKGAGVGEEKFSIDMSHGYLVLEGVNESAEGPMLPCSSKSLESTWKKRRREEREVRFAIWREAASSS
jgi:hypothetical protein